MLVTRVWDRLEAATFAPEGGPQGMLRGTGARGGYRAVFGRLRAGVIGLLLRYGQTGPMSSQKAGVARQRLRRVLEVVGGDGCLGEHVAFDIGGQTVGVSDGAADEGDTFRIREGPFSSHPLRRFPRGTRGFRIMT